MSSAFKTPTKYQHIFKTVQPLKKLKFRKLLTKNFRP